MTRSLLRRRAAWSAAACACLFLLHSMASPRSMSTLAAPPSPRPDPRFEPLRQAIKRVSTQRQLPSLSVAVAHQGKILFEESIGWADLQGRQQANPDTMYSLGAVTMPYTATLVMLLSDRGDWSLDHAADKYLRAGVRLSVHEGRPADVTLRRLLTHTAGLPPHYQFFYGDAGELPPPASTTIKRYGIIANPPGETYLFSNLGYSILGHGAGRAAKKDYLDVLKEQVLDPLGLKRTDMYPRNKLPNVALRYGDDLKLLPPYSTDHLPASALYASAHDLVRFGMLHLRNRPPDLPALLKDETIQAMQKSAVPAEADGPGSSRGLGWAIKDNDYGYRRVGQAGSMPGAAAHLALIPQENLAVAVLSNKNEPGAVAEIADLAIGVILPQFAAALAAKPRTVTPEEKPARFVPEPGLQGSWDGIVQTWQSTVPLVLKVEPGGRVRVKLADQPETDLLEPRFQGGVFTGRFDGTIPTEDARKHKHQVELSLKPRGPRLAGWASAVMKEGRIYGSLASWAEVWRPGARPSPKPSPSPSPTIRPGKMEEPPPPIPTPSPGEPPRD